MNHTLIHVLCDGCSYADMLTLLEHPRDSEQTQAISEAHHTMADHHADETGHYVEVGVTTGSPDEIRSTAQSMAEGIDGADPDDFTPEMMTDGGKSEDKQPSNAPLARYCKLCGDGYNPNLKISISDEPSENKDGEMEYGWCHRQCKLDHDRFFAEAEANDDWDLPA